MSCSACSAAVERAVKRINGVENVDVNLLSKNMNCEYDDKIVFENDIINAIKKAGFDATIEKVANTSESSQQTEPTTKKDSFTNIKTRLIVSICFLIPLMYISMGHMIGLPFTNIFHNTQNAITFAFTQFLLTLPIIYVNRKFFFVGFKALSNRSPNMDSLVAVGSLAAMIYGVFAIYMLGYGLGKNSDEIVSHYIMNLYFESAAMILTLVTVGKFLEERSKAKTNSAITKLLDLSPKNAIILKDNIEKEIPVSEIMIDDIIIIKPGEKIPVDGIIVDGNSSLDQSALTGESIPADKTIGDNVLSASINIDGFLKIQAKKVGKDTTLAHIIKLVENASNSKAPIAKMADKVSGVFVPIVMLISLISIIVWLLLGKGFEFSLGIGIAVLVVSCPCALGLATPVAIMVAMGRSASKGILVKSAESLEILHSVDTVVFDKTGTITVGKPSVTDIVSNNIDSVSNADFIRIASSLEMQSEHPLSKAICEFAKKENIKSLKATNFKAIFGKGVTAEIENQTYYGGNKSYMDELFIDTTELTKKADELAYQGKTPLYFATDKKILGIIAVADTIKDTSKIAIEKLKSNKIKVIMLTGDNKITANAIKSQLSIDEVIADVFPQNKEEIIQNFQSEGKIVAMVGDGINDSPALSRANVGIAVGNGTDIAIDSADIVLMKNDLRDVYNAITFSKKVIANIKQNLFWAFFYNVLGIPIAAGILFIPFGITLSPMIASIAMSFSSVFVVTNALRLYKK